jgi:hypothetical protein
MLFLGQFDRFWSALNRLDPLQDDVLVSRLDPLPRGRALTSVEGRIPVAKAWGFFGSLATIVIGLSMLPTPWGGGVLFGPGSILWDMAVVSIMLNGLLMSLFVLWGRRLLGDLINELAAEGIAIALPNPLNTQTVRTAPKLLRFLLWGTSPSVVKYYIPIIWISNAAMYWTALSDGVPDWSTSLAQPSTAMYFLSVGSEQPTISGFLAFFVLLPLIGYLYVPAVRLFLFLGLIASAIAENPEVRLTPSHPDGAGGLMAFGQASLFLGAGVLTSGVALSGMTYQWLQSHAFSFGAMPVSMYAYWLLYLTLGPVLFVAPASPLTKTMRLKKREYLMRMNLLFLHAEEVNAKSASVMEFNSE